MANTHVLANIPQEIQARYNIGETVEVVASGESMGGNFAFVNREGRGVNIDAVELSSTDITIRALK
jgi:hypothetical protein